VVVPQGSEAQVLSVHARNQNSAGILVDIKGLSSGEIASLVLGDIRAHQERIAPDLEALLLKRIQAIKDPEERLAFALSGLSLGRYSMALLEALGQDRYEEGLLLPQTTLQNLRTRTAPPQVMIAVDYELIRGMNNARAYIDYQQAVLREQTGHKPEAPVFFGGENAVANFEEAVQQGLVNPSDSSSYILSDSGISDAYNAYAVSAGRGARRVESQRFVLITSQSLAAKETGWNKEVSGHLMAVKPAAQATGVDQLGLIIIRGYDVARLEGQVDGLLGMIVDRKNNIVILVVTKPIDWGRLISGARQRQIAIDSAA
jgi:hypothetical protein